MSMFAQYLLAALTIDQAVLAYSFLSCTQASVDHSSCLGFTRNASFLNAYVYHTWNWASDRGSVIDPVASLIHQERKQPLSSSYSSSAPMAATQQGTPINILWPRVDLNDGTINGTQRTWVYCDKNSPLRNTPNANAAFDSDGNLVDLTPVNSSWYSTPEDAPGALHPATAYTLLNSHSFCNSKSGNPDDLNPSDCNCFTKDTGPDSRLSINTKYREHCSGSVSIPSTWGTGVFTCVWLYQINKPGYFN